ncbi:glycosyl hydrolase [Burkholderia thailandensis]|uniref:glycosyl hydrolase n=1 Tax=Burkholderia thailandensis TaxID=57975 RepID=UPI0003ECA43C|nr:glycosyl hydrolase [Burkholderia thailandensis]AHI67618.1 glycosyl hydrolase catalytic core family protein [Burkholderia thailandensis H0587]AOJ53030.1 beta-glucosidase [Burkholderia thailandensis]AVR28856.1 beta-glucosidase [Burkholderia thailandensis]MCZ2898884.1 glycoside hydrolase family protein [Burkholderia thailandensis]MDD1481418.1 beta-glucosidase [Burkholderia thailandensis]
MKRLAAVATSVTQSIGIPIHYPKATAILFTLLLCACGGGGGDQSKVNAAASPVNSVVAPAAGTSSSGTAAPAPGASSPSETASALPFFGANGHYVGGGVYASVPLATQASHLAGLGMTVYRQDAYIPDHIDALASAAIPGLGAGITVLPMIEAHPWADPSLNGQQPTEASAYAYAYKLSVYAAKKLAGIPMVEFGNEYDVDSHNAPIQGDGINISDYDNSTFPIWRGALRGALDGWRSVDTNHTTKLIANATSGALHFGFLDGLMTGTQPDGTTGHPKITPDVIQWHWYSNGGDFENALGKTGRYNVLARLKDRYNLPIVITEIGVNTDNSDAQIAAYIAKTIPELVAAKAAYNVIGFNWYELYDDRTGPYGLMTNNAQEKPRYGLMRAAIAGAVQN